MCFSPMLPEDGLQAIASGWAFLRTFAANRLGYGKRKILRGVERGDSRRVFDVARLPGPDKGL